MADSTRHSDVGRSLFCLAYVARDVIAHAYGDQQELGFIVENAPFSALREAVEQVNAALMTNPCDHDWTEQRAGSIPIYVCEKCGVATGDPDSEERAVTTLEGTASWVGLGIGTSWDWEGSVTERENLEWGPE